jgi:hypothetical protein
MAESPNVDGPVNTGIVNVVPWPLTAFVSPIADARWVCAAQVIAAARPSV